ncbi:MAG: cobalamin biosynthesis protein P47K [Verrucomicrobia bacterium]|nr:cobalamin biosynthesis protein P47K [Verrucomicrobiota bacterium]
MKPSAPSGASQSKARYIMIGGFLGAGKTTAVGKLARQLTDRGLRVGLITNDQGRELVDTLTLRAQGFDTAEILGGCFCCRFNSLVEASQKLSVKTRPDVFIAEPVGSCTDLVATVTYPLRRLYGNDFVVAPVSVMVDPVRAARVLGVEKGGGFSEKVAYIYAKQLEEADLIVINKCDLLDSARLKVLREALAKKFPRTDILTVSSRTGMNLDAWFARLASETQTARRAMEVDYDLYADGEALMGWLNCTVQFAAAQLFDADSLLQQFAGEIQKRLQAQQAEIAHLKMTFSADGGSDHVAVANLVRNDFVPELSLKLGEPVKGGELILNLRAEASPDVLAATVKESVPAVAARFPTLQAKLDHLEHFRPGRPNPTHRDKEAVA